MALPTTTNENFARIAALPEAAQSTLLARLYEDPAIRTDPAMLKALVRETLLKEHARGPELEQVQSLGAAKLEMELALLQGESIESIKAKAISSGNVAQAAVVNTVTQEHKEEKQREQVAQADEVHREKVGLTVTDQGAHPMANLIHPELVAAIGNAMGGAQHGLHTDDVAMVTGGKEAQRGGPAGGRA